MRGDEGDGLDQVFHRRVVGLDLEVVDGEAQGLRIRAGVSSATARTFSSKTGRKHQYMDNDATVCRGTPGERIEQSLGANPQRAQVYNARSHNPNSRQRGGENTGV